MAPDPLVERYAADVVFLEGLEFYAYHGVNPEEQTLGQRFLVDVELRIDLRSAGQTDALGDTINYSAVYQQVRGIMTGPPRRLIETVAHEIALTLLSEFPAEQVVMTIRKPEAPLRDATLSAAGVRVVRSVDDLET